MLLLAYIYLSAVFLLSLYGLHRSCMTWQLMRRPYRCPPPLAPASFPRICVQLPIYNESRVVERLLRAVAALDYPREHLSVQVLDDSTDQTSTIIDMLVADLKIEGIDIRVLRRPLRKNFKAGALQNGIEQTDADLIAIFDADFVPAPDILKRIAPYFNDGDVGFVQARWGHLNRNSSLLTRAQALLIDAHFVVEHALRYSSGAFFNFNGTAGVWKREAIMRSGGWTGDTLTEDLDLSYRAQLQGWRGMYLRDVVCMGELPETVAAFKSQQYRWTKGTAQVFRKLIWRILIAPLPARQKFEAFMHLSANFCYILMLTAALLLVPIAAWRAKVYFFIGAWFELVVFLFTFFAMIWFYLFSQRLQTRCTKLIDLFAAITIGIGVSAHCALASIAGLCSYSGEFVRTPKWGLQDNLMLSFSSKRRKLSSPRISFKGQLKESVMFVYLIGGLCYSLYCLNFLTVPFVLLILAGYTQIVLAARDYP